MIRTTHPFLPPVEEHIARRSDVHSSSAASLVRSRIGQVFVGSGRETS